MYDLRNYLFSGDSWQVLMEYKHLSVRAVLYFRAVVKAVKGLNADTRIALLGVKQKTIAAELGLVQSTVNKRLNRAGWKNLSQYLDFIEYHLKGR